jgi:uncharacterized protein YigA (DUF484 family)
MAKRQVKQPIVNVSQSVQVSGGIGSYEFSKLLNLQEESLSTQKGIKEIIASGSMASAAGNESMAGDLKAIKELTTNLGETLDNQLKVIEAERQVADLKKEQVEQAEELKRIAKEELQAIKESAKQRAEEAEAIATIATGMKTFKNLSDKLGDFKKSFSDKFGAGNRLKTTMSALNIGGVFNKQIAKQDFIKQQKALGSTKTNKELAEDFKNAQKSSKAIKSTEAEIESFKKTTGLSDAQLDKTVEGKRLLAKRQAQTDEYSKFDLKTNLVRQENPDTASSVGEAQEAAAESARVEQEQTSLLKVIAEKIGGDVSEVKPSSAKPEGGGGLLDGITSFLGQGLMKTFKTLFSPGNILKSLGKIFVIGAIIGSLFEGITDGFNEYMESGDIGKALIAGLAGIVDFLTFGLFDKEKIKEVIGDFATWTNEHLIQPFVEFITGIKDSFMSMIENIGVPEIKFKIPVVNKEVSIGPFYPFKSDTSKQSSSPSAPPPTSGEQVTSASKQNADNAAVAGKTTPNTNIVNAPTTNVSKQTQVVALPVRNQDESMSRYMRSRYA